MIRRKTFEQRSRADVAEPAPSSQRSTVPFERIDLDEELEDDRPPLQDLLGMQRARAGAVAGPLASAFFAPLPVAHRAGVLARFHLRAAEVGTMVIGQGETAHPLVLVARGRLDVRAVLADGRVVQVGTIGLGEFIGEVSLLGRTAAPAQVIAATEAELLVLAPNDFYELAAAYPALDAELKHVAERRSREHARRLR